MQELCGPADACCLFPSLGLSSKPGVPHSGSLVGAWCHPHHGEISACPSGRGIIAGAHGGLWIKDDRIAPRSLKVLELPHLGAHPLLNRWSGADPVWMPRALQALCPKRPRVGGVGSEAGVPISTRQPPVLQLGLQIVRNPAAKTRNHQRTRLKDSTTWRGTGMSGQHNLPPQSLSTVANRRKGASFRARRNSETTWPPSSCLSDVRPTCRSKLPRGRRWDGQINKTALFLMVRNGGAEGGRGGNWA